MDTKKSNKKIISIAIIGLCVLLAVAGSIYFFTRPKEIEGAKEIIVEINHGADSETKSVTIKTDAASLLDAMIEQGLILEKDYTAGQIIDTIDGKTANSNNREFWSLTKNGEMSQTGFAETMIADGEKYEVTLSTW